MRRKLLASGAVLFAVVSILLGASPASAAPLDPVVPLPYTPTQIQSALSGYSNASDVSKAYLKAYLLAFNAAKNSGQTVEVASATALATTPKPISAPAALSRGAGSVLTAFMGGWAIGQGGLALYAAATGSDYQTVVCSQPDWYQGANSFILLGFGPTCAPAIIYPNEDQAQTITFAGTGTTFTQYFYAGAGGNWPVACGSNNTSHGAGITYRAYNPSNNGTGGWVSGIRSYGYTCGSSSATRWLIASGASNHLGVAYTRFQLFNSNTSTVVEEAVITRANPGRTIGCKVTHTGGSTTRTASGTYQESAGLPVAKINEACKSAWDARPSGTIPSKISVESDDAGSKTTISEQNLSPDSLPAETGAGKPGLILKKVVGAVAQSCNTWAADCSNWWDETSEGTSTTSPYRCEFAGAAVALVECGPYRHSFDSQTATPVVTDPITGNPTEWAASPSVGNSISPGVGPGTGPSPADTCFAEGWAAVANPVDWVLVPVKCALVWAFVPRASVVNAGFENLEDRWQSTAVGGLSAAVAGWAFVAPSSSGCNGINVPLGEIFGHGISDFEILNACPGSPLQPIAALSTLVLGIGAVLGAIRAVTGSIGGIVGQKALADGSPS